MGNAEWHCVCAYELQCMNDELYGDVLKWGGVFLLGFFCCCFLVWFGLGFVLFQISNVFLSKLHFLSALSP